MKEDFIQFVWQYQYFSKDNLSTQSGSTINVIHPGYLNSDSGPDFSSAKIQIDGLEWIGNVEFHIKSSNWYSHNHNEDQAFDNVILHVVWEHDKEVYRTDKSLIPTLELKNRVDHSLILSYKKLVRSPNTIACSSHFLTLEEITKRAMIDRVLLQRLERKAFEIQQLYQSNNNNWEETAYQTLAKNFGFKVNSSPFYRLGKSMPLRIIKKHAGNLIQVEAFLFGQAGLLEESIQDEYHASLRKEFRFLSQKYQLEDSGIHASHWKFMRLRPANFPTLRIAQFAALITQLNGIFSVLTSTEDVKFFNKILKVNPSEYWSSHYQFGKESRKSHKPLGEDSCNNLLINSVAPLLVAYGHLMASQNHIDRAVELLEMISPEKNKIINLWNELEQKVGNAADSQALIELFNTFCVKKRCLNCTIGVKLLQEQ